MNLLIIILKIWLKKYLLKKLCDKSFSKILLEKDFSQKIRSQIFFANFLKNKIWSEKYQAKVILSQKNQVG